MNTSFYMGAVGASTSASRLNVVANNIANSNNNAFKPKTVVFTELLNYKLNDSGNAEAGIQTGSGGRTQRIYTTFDTAGVLQTNSRYDYAIQEPNAFFMLQDPTTGDFSYSRNGHFRAMKLDDGFYLANDSGKMVLDQNKEPIHLDMADVEKMQAEMEEGYEPEDDYDETDENDNTDKPRVSLYTFANPSRLTNSGGYEYVPIDADAEPILIEHAKMVNGALESSGTDLVKELTQMIECQKAYTYALKMVTTSDEIEGTINTLRG